MKDAKTISEFVKYVFSKYSLCYPVYFPDYDENDELIPAPVFENEIVTTEKLHYLSKILGMSIEDISEANKEVALKIYNKYSFFALLQKYEEHKHMAKFEMISENISIEDQRLLYRFFGDEGLKKKYSDEDLIARLTDQLKEYDKILPGTYHPNGEITSFRHEECTLIDFPECEKLLISFFEVYDRLNSLFFKALKKDLLQEEIYEYNLFVSYFRANEWASSSTMLYYDILCKYRQIYIDEGYTMLDSYLKINNFATNFEPWLCKQFAYNKELAQRYQDIYPNTKESIKDLCMNIKNIMCSFKWSDDPFIEDDDDDFVPEKFRLGKYQEWTRIYIPKTELEIGSDVESAVLMSELASPTSKGGLIKRTDEVGRDTQTLINRMVLRQKVK